MGIYTKAKRWPTSSLVKVYSDVPVETNKKSLPRKSEKSVSNFLYGISKQSKDRSVVGALIVVDWSMQGAKVSQAASSLLSLISRSSDLVQNDFLRYCYI